MGLPLIGLGLTIGGSFMQAGMAASAAKQQAAVANQQLKIDMTNERIKGLQDANARQEEYLRNDSANRVAASAGVGGGRNLSYEQGISPYNKGVAQRDLQTIGFNTGQRIARSKYQISVNRFNAKSEATSAYVGAAADSLGSIGTFMARPGGLLE